LATKAQRSRLSVVIPAKAGIQAERTLAVVAQIASVAVIPAKAGIQTEYAPAMDVFQAIICTRERYNFLAKPPLAMGSACYSSKS